MNIRRLTLTGLATLGVLCGGLLTFSASALAAGEFAFKTTFGTEGEGNGEFKAPLNTAVQQTTGDIFVADSENHRVQIFGPDGEYLSQISGSGVPGGLAAIRGVVVDNSTSASAGDVYIVDQGTEVIDKFKPLGSSPGQGYEYVCQITGPSGGCVSSAGPTFEHPPASVAVDGGGNVYVSLQGESVEEFDAEGNYLATLGSAIGNSQVAVDAAGNAVYVASLSGTVVKLAVDPTSHVLLSEVILAEEPGFKAVAVDQANGTVFVGNSSGGVKEYEELATDKTGEEPLEEFGGQGEIGGLSAGIAYSSHGNGEIYVTDLAGNDVHIFSPESSGLRPEATCLEPAEVRAKTATLACTVSPANGEPAHLHFEYKEADQSFTKTAESTITATGKVEETITGLKPETRYIYRVVVSNAHGEMVSNRIGFYTSSPVAGLSACSATGVGSKSAKLEGSLEPRGVATEYDFEYGLSTAYGAPGSPSPVEHSSNSEPQPAETVLTDLEPDATYDCRLAASDAEGTNYGANGAFNTLPAPPTVNELAPSSSQITRTSARLSGTVNPDNSPTKYHFEYGTTTAYGSNTEEASAGAGYGDLPVGPKTIVELQPGTTYHYRLVATNEAAGTETGPDYTFTTASRTLPLVDTGGASGLTQTDATISGVLDPQGIETGYAFEVGTDTTYSGAKVFGDAGDGEGAEPLAVGLEDLAPGTTYHYRLTATNADGTSYGQDMTFTTPGIPSPIGQPFTMSLLATPSIAFPTETGTTKTTTKAPTRAQKLAAALKTCRTKKKGKRAGCEKQARKEYPPAKAVAKKTQKRSTKRA